MPKYSIGDKVRVRRDLELSKSYYMEDSCSSNSATEEMVAIAGEIVTINEVFSSGGGYHIMELSWGWTDGMFDDISESPAKRKFDWEDFKQGEDKVILCSSKEDFEVIKTEFIKHKIHTKASFPYGKKLGIRKNNGYLIGESYEDIIKDYRNGSWNIKLENFFRFEDYIWGDEEMPVKKATPIIVDELDLSGKAKSFNGLDYLVPSDLKAKLREIQSSPKYYNRDMISLVGSVLSVLGYEDSASLILKYFGIETE